ncbi:phage tail protein X [Tibeticola sediminis]|uniref:Phage tail protein X n=1 Tax=Tibeticola sediminis TaxID=1917811 RepID=A0A3N4VF98_9BURK|nr:tail protein X [Tibeticola sediminis]RPE72550.1 phage tail protein X [Tibeticola sediminis]
MSATYTTREGDRLDLICWRWYGTLAGTVERVLDANPGLAARDPARLPAGLIVVMPSLPRRAPEPRAF